MPSPDAGFHPRWSAVLAAGVVGLAAVLGGAFLAGPRVVVGVALALLLAVASLAPWAVRLEDVCLLGLIAWGCIVASLQARALLDAREVLGSWLAAWCLWVVAGQAGSRGRELALTVLTAASGLLAIGVGLEFAGCHVPRAGGLLENPNIAAALLVPTAAATIRVEGGRPRLWSLAVALGLVLAAVLTGSRAGLLAAVVAVVVMLPRGRLRLGAAVTGVALAAATLLWRFASHPDPLAWHRLAIWRALLVLVAAHPLTGVGPGALAEAAGRVRIAHPEMLGASQRLIGSAESRPIGVLVLTGVVGLALAAAAVVAWSRSARAAGLLSSPRARGVVAAVATIALVHDQLEVDVVLWWWALLLGLTASAREVASGRPSRLGPLRAVALAWTVLWALAQPAYGRWLWATGARSAELAERVERVEPWLSTPAHWCTLDLLGRETWSWRTAAEALAWGERATGMHPGQASLWAALGRVHTRVVSELAWSEASVEAARAAFGRACELEPYLPWYWAEWAGLERRLGNLEAARSLALHAVTVEPGFVRGQLLLARLELDLGRVDAARRALTAARRAQERSRGRLLTRYERELVAAPRWQLETLAEALR